MKHLTPQRLVIWLAVILAAVLAISLVGCDGSDSPTEPSRITAKFRHNTHDGQCVNGFCTMGVNFVNESTGPGTRNDFYYSWDFDDGNDSSEIDPEHEYEWRCVRDGEFLDTNNLLECDPKSWTVYLEACLDEGKTECDLTNQKVNAKP